MKRNDGKASPSSEMQTDSTPKLPLEDWYIFRNQRSKQRIAPKMPEAPPWRRFDGGPVVRRVSRWDTGADRGRAASYVAGQEEVRMVNAALHLRRPLLITGKPGVGKSSLAFAVAYELRLGTPLYWSITSKTKYHDGLYRYDTIGRLQESDPSRPPKDVGEYITLGPLGTAMLPVNRPRVLLVDEIDKGDDDLMSDLLNVFEEGQYELPELIHEKGRSATTKVYTWDRDQVPIRGGLVRCKEFPLIFLTSNEDREFSAPFLRRCLRLNIQPPDREKLIEILVARLDSFSKTKWTKLVDQFLTVQKEQSLATDQLLHAVFLLSSVQQKDSSTGKFGSDEAAMADLVKSLWHALEVNRD